MSSLPTPANTLHAAELRAERARAQLHVTLGQVQDRLDPRQRAEKVVRDARIAGETAVAIAKQKPAAVGGMVAGTVLFAGAVLFRRRIARLFAGTRSSPASAGLHPVTRTNP